MSTTSNHSTRYVLINMLLMGVLCAIALCTFRDYGISADEGLRARYGKAVLAYYTSGFEDTRSQRMRAASLYGGIFDTAAAAAIAVSPFDEFDTRHLLGAVVGLFGIFGAYRLATLIAGRRSGLFAAGLLAIIPGYWGSMFFNPKDIPFAVGYLWTLYFLLRGLSSIFKPNLKDSLYLGLAFGATLAVKVVAVVLFVPIGTALLLAFSESRNISLKLRLKSLARFLIPACLIAYGVMILFWPWTHTRLLSGPIEALTVFSDFPFWQNEVLLFGETYSWKEIPWNYLPSYFLVQLPELVLLLLGYGLVLALRTSCLEPGSCLKAHRGALLVLIIAAFFPPLVAILKGSTIYSGYRHFLFCVPLFAVFAGIALDHFLVQVIRRRLWLITSVVMLAYVCVHVSLLVRLHPYQYTYFNSLVGGLAGAHSQFETDYWATSYREAVSELILHTHELQRNGDQRQMFRVAVCGPAISSNYFFPPFLLPARQEDNPEFIITSLRGKCANLSGEVVAAVTRMGAPLAVVRRVDLNTYPHEIPALQGANTPE